MIFIFGIISGLLLNYIFGGFEFNTLLCFFVGIFLIMPVLLKIKFSDLKSVFFNKKLISYNVIINFICIPLIAFLVGYFVFGMENFQYVFTLLLLSLIPGGGLLMHRMNQTKSNLNIGFSLFAINLFIFSFVYIIYNFATGAYVEGQVNNSTNITQDLQKENKFFIKTDYSMTDDNFLISSSTNNSNPGESAVATCAIRDLCNNITFGVAGYNFGDNVTLVYGFYGFAVLILFPFIISRIILFFIKGEKRKVLLKYVSYVSKTMSFILILYIFSLSYIRQILEIDLYFIYKSIISVFIFYILLFIFLKFVLKFGNFEKSITKSIFWNAFTRFITLALILSVLYSISWSAPGIIIIPIFAYFIQIGFATLLAMFDKNGNSSES